MGDGVLRCSLNLSQKVLADYPMCCSSHSTLLHFTSTLDIVYILHVLPLLNCPCILCLMHMFLILPHFFSIRDDNMGQVLFRWFCLVICGVLLLMFAVFDAHFCFCSMWGICTSVENSVLSRSLGSNCC